MDLPFPKRSANDLSGCLVDHHLGFQTMLLFLAAVVGTLFFSSVVKLAGEKLQNLVSCKQDTLQLYPDGKNPLSTCR